MHAIGYAQSELRTLNWKVQVTGPAEEDYLREVKGTVARLGISDLVSITNAVDDLTKWKLLSQVELLVLPSFSENFGMIVAEALASETPVITTTGTPWSILADKRAGWWIAPTPRSLGATIVTAICLRGEERRSMGRRGRELMRERFSWDVVGELMIDAYARVLGNFGAPNRASATGLPL